MERTRVLYINDSVVDCALLELELAKSGEFSLVAAFNKETLNACLVEVERYDVVLSDFSIFGSGGLPLVAAVMAARPNVPLIIVTSPEFEEMAVEALQLGAVDYVIKRHGYITRLRIVIRSVAELARLRRENRLAEDQVDRIFAMSQEMLFVFDRSGAILRMSPAAAAFHGDSTVAKTAPSIYDLLLPDNVDAFRDQLRHVLGGQDMFQWVSRAHMGQGGFRWVEWNATWSIGALAFYCVARDASDRMLAEEVRRQSAAAAEAIETLSIREREVFGFVCEGISNKVIAHRLDLSEKSVERHRSHGMKTLGLKSVPALVRLMTLSTSVGSSG